MEGQSENNSPLGNKFNDFEFTPSNSLFDGIQDGLTKDPEQGALNQKFDDFNTAVSESVWPKIEKELHPRKKRRAIIWWGAAACLVVAFGVSSLDFLTVKNGNSIAENKFDLKEELNDFNNVSSQLSKPKEPNRSGLQEYVGLGNDGKRVANSSNIKKPLIVEPKVTNDKASFFESIIINPKRITFPQGDYETIEKEEFRDLAAELFKDLEPEKNEKKVKRNRINPYTGSLLSSQGGLFSRRSDESYSDEPIINDNPIEEEGPDGGTGVTVSGGAEEEGPENMFFPSGDPMDEEEVYNELAVGSDFLNYKSPITIGLQYERSISERLAISAGVNFTKVEFEYDLGFWKDYGRFGTENYLGVPINVTYDLVKKSKVGLYSLIGCQADFGVKKKEQLGLDELPEGIAFEKAPLGNHVSALAGLGLSVGISKNLSVYGQSVLQNYFLNSKDGYFNEESTNLNIQAGLKLSF